MSLMFHWTNIFDQNLSNWDVSQVTDMNRMFRSARAFDGDLSSWDISQVIDMNGMLDNSGLSTENYDASLKGWAELPALQSNITLGAKSLQYCTSEADRQSIIDTYGWNITSNTLACPTAKSSPTTETTPKKLESLHDISDQLMVYLNPASNFIFIQYKAASLSEDFTVEIVDMARRTLLLKGANNRVNIPQLKQGLYIILVKGDAQFGQIKFLKQ